MSRKFTAVSDCVVVNLICGWKLLSSDRNLSRSLFLGHTINMSSMYLRMNKGLSEVEDKNFLSSVDIKILATVGENAAPIAVPFLCKKVMSANSKKLLVIFS
uniref:Uncharacterized protein n=1 Tax=Amphimedon queenslandica TaxID=400682 RepID=A0A1X7UFW3_AMPQE